MTLATGQVRLERQFTVTPDRLWHLLTDPQARTAWGAPSDDDNLIMDAHDLREGGRDLHRCGPADNPAYTVETVWFRLQAPDLACFTETVDAEGMRIATSLVTYGIAPMASGTSLIVDVYVSSFVGPEALADFETGWTSALGRLRAIIDQSTQA